MCMWGGGAHSSLRIHRPRKMATVKTTAIAIKNIIAVPVRGVQASGIPLFFCHVELKKKKMPRSTGPLFFFQQIIKHVVCDVVYNIVYVVVAFPAPFGAQ